MIPKVTNGGRSFKGAASYYLFDKGQTTTQRVAWTHTENLLTTDPHKAWRVMAYTAKEAERLKEASGQKATGRKLERPVLAYSLAWHPEQNPDKEHMLATARQSIEALGLTEHEALIVAHRDEPQKHVHVIINRVHPLTGIAAHTGRSKLQLSAFALEYEKAHGKIYCQQREDNHRQREKGKHTMHRDSVIGNAWKASDSGRGFAAALSEKGYTLAQGRKRVVVVDAHGQVHNPLRHLDGVRAKDIRKRLEDLDTTRLPDAAEVSRSIQERGKEDYHQRQEKLKASIEAQNRLQSQHHEERATVFNRHHDRIESERTRLDEYYQLKQQQKAIDALEKKTSNAGWWRKLFKLTRHDEQRLDELRKNHQNATQRQGEQIGHLERDRDQALQALAERQDKERQLLLEHGPEALQAWRDRNKVREPAPNQQWQMRAPGMRR